MSSSKNIVLSRDFAARVYYRLETQSFKWYFRLSFVNGCPVTFSLAQPPPPFPVRISILYTRIQCVRGGGYSILGFRQTLAAKFLYR